MRKIKIFDTTLRDGEQAPGCTMHHAEKLEIADKLERLGVDIIEAGFPVSSEGDFLAVKAVAERIVNSEVCALSRAIERDIDIAAESLKSAAAPRLHIFIPTSDLHIKTKLKIDRSEVLERIKTITEYGRNIVGNVQIGFEDATRSDREFLLEAVKIAQKSGANAITIADTVGYSCPEEISELIRFLRERSDVDNIEFGIHCHNDLGMAAANSLSAVLAGVTHVECTLNGIGERSGNAPMEEVVMALKAKPEYKADTRIVTKEIYSASRLLSSIIGTQIPPNKPIIGSNVFLHESGIHQHGVLVNRSTYEIITPESIGVPKPELILGKHSGMHAFKEFIDELGLQYNEELIEKHFKDFKELCDKKKVVTALDIEALVGDNRYSASDAKYRLKNFLIATKKDGAFATVTLMEGDKEVAYQADGNGAIDSSFTAINKILPVSFKLIDFVVRSITGGEDALGEAMVRICDDTFNVVGRGLSTDIVEASLIAYLDAANRLISLRHMS